MKKIKNRIFVDKKINLNGQIILDANQIHYLNSVLRTKKNDYVSVFNRDLLCLTKVINITKNTCELEIIDKKKNLLGLCKVHWNKLSLKDIN